MPRRGSRATAGTTIGGASGRPRTISSGWRRVGRWPSGGGRGGGLSRSRALDGGGDLPRRVHASTGSEQLATAAEQELRSGDPLGLAGGRARFGWLKLFADGTLASRTAALLEPIE